MPVSVLFCEGGPNSPDIRVLSKLLSGHCQIRDSGGKYGMGERIKAWREVREKGNNRDICCGILDGDFSAEWKNPANEPRRWESDDKKIHFGWRWERKEIENYLIDPVVVEKALGKRSPQIDTYTQTLKVARDSIAIYQAARTALGTHRRRFNPLYSAFGKECGREKHPFPAALDEESCINGIRENIRKYGETQIINEKNVLHSFESFKSECLEGGQRFNNFLQAFSGKDLLWAMNDWLAANEFTGALAFREKVVSGVQQSTEDISTWLPE
ncbi:MAG: hypothetical protein NT166_02840 [Candidatus Aminicenantes bacterium]|nr:hypothetical protein [Candidatus Aminicenantes bacterium]